MLNKPSEQMRACYEHAGDCARNAARQTDPRLKHDFLDAERRWLALALTYKADLPMGLIHRIRATIEWGETIIESHQLLACTRASITETKREISESRRLIEASQHLLAACSAEPVALSVRQNTNAHLSVRVAHEGTSFAWTLNGPASELLGRGTADTEKRARIDAFAAGMMYMNYARERSSPKDVLN